MRKAIAVFVLVCAFAPSLSAQSPVLRNGFPVLVELNSTGWGDSGPTLADVTGDGMLEIINCSANAVYIIRHNGTLLPGWPQRAPSPYVFNYSAAVGDITGDGNSEIVALARDATPYGDSLCFVYAWTATGELLPGFPIGFGASRHSPVLYDLDGDGILEIIQVFVGGGHYCSGEPAKCYIIKGNGSVMAGWPQVLGPKTGTPKPAVGDIDGDGLPEVITLLGTCYDSTPPKKPWLYAWHWNGIPVNGFPREYGIDPLPIDLNPLHEPALLPPDNNGNRRIAFAAYFFQFFPTLIDSNLIWVVDHAGNIVPGWPRDTDGFSAYAPLISYKTQIDSTPGVGINVANRIRIWTASAAPAVDLWAGGSINKFGLGDLDTVSAGFEYALAPYWSGFGFQGFYSDGQQLNWSPLTMWGGAGYQQPAFGDLDNDGNVEVVVMSRLYPPPPDTSRGYIWCWTFPGLRFSKDRFPWPMYGHDRLHTSQAGFDPDSVIVNVKEPSEQPTASKLHQNFPNPFNALTTIRYDMLESGHVNLTVCDVLGREVAVLVNEFNEKGKHTVRFNASRFASGVYFYRLLAGQFSETRRLLLLR